MLDLTGIRVYKVKYFRTIPQNIEVNVILQSMHFT